MLFARQIFARASVALVSGLLATSLAARAQETVVLENHVVDNGEKGKVTFPRIEFSGTNLTRDEVVKLFSPATSKDDALALASKLKASRISIPSAMATAKDGNLTVSDMLATNVDSGKVGQVAVGSIDGVFPADNGGTAKVKAGALRLDGADLGGMFQAIRTNDLASGVAQFSKFSWQNIAIEAPDKDTPASAPGGNTIRIAIGAISADGIYEGPLPLRLTVGLTGLSADFPPASDTAKKLAEAGIQKLDMTFNFAGTYDPGTKAYSLTDLTMGANGLGSLTLKGQFTGVEPGAFSGPQNGRIMALIGAGVGGLELRFANAGGVEKALERTGKEQNKSPETLKQEMANMAGQMIPILLGGDANALRITEQVQRFLGDPKGLTVVAKAKSGSLGFVELMGIRDPASLFDKADIQVTADGAPMSSAAPPAAVQTPAMPPSAPAQTAQAARPEPAQNQRLTGLAAWNALVGNSIDGKSADGDALTEYYLRNGTVKQLLDDETATGKWTVKGEKVCFEFPDDEEETCYRVSVDGDTATFTEDDGSGRRYKILPGNPKKL